MSINLYTEARVCMTPSRQYPSVAEAITYAQETHLVARCHGYQGKLVALVVDEDAQQVLARIVNGNLVQRSYVNVTKQCCHTTFTADTKVQAEALHTEHHTIVQARRATAGAFN